MEATVLWAWWQFLAELHSRGWSNNSYISCSKVRTRIFRYFSIYNGTSVAIVLCVGLLPKTTGTFECGSIMREDLMKTPITSDINLVIHYDLHCYECLCYLQIHLKVCLLVLIMTLRWDSSPHKRNSLYFVHYYQGIFELLVWNKYLDKWRKYYYYFSRCTLGKCKALCT